MSSAFPVCLVCRNGSQVVDYFCSVDLLVFFNSSALCLGGNPTYGPLCACTSHPECRLERWYSNIFLSGTFSFSVCLLQGALSHVGVRKAVCKNNIAQDLFQALYFPLCFDIVNAFFSMVLACIILPCFALCWNSFMILSSFSCALGYVFKRYTGCCGGISLWLIWSGFLSV